MRSAQLAAGRHAAKTGLRRLLASAGYTIRRRPVRDLDSETTFLKFHSSCAPYTGTSIERMYALYQAASYVVAKGIPGSFVECGVWRGGSSMLAALTFLERGDRSRELYLYDTFAGMSAPTGKDVTVAGQTAAAAGDGAAWSSGGTTLPDVRANLNSTGFPPTKISLVEGKVEDTIPATLPGQIAVLRLDTDWYESTYHELCHLFPLLAPSGVLIVDDYGYWLGAREAVDQYFHEQQVDILLSRIDLTGRMGIKA